MKRADFERLLGPYEELWRYEALRKVSTAVGAHVCWSHMFVGRTCSLCTQLF